MTFWKIILDAGREKVGSVSVDRFELPLIHSALSVTGTGIRILPVLLVKSDRLLGDSNKLDREFTRNLSSSVQIDAIALSLSPKRSLAQLRTFIALSRKNKLQY